MFEDLDLLDAEILGEGLTDAPSLDTVRAGRGVIKRGMRGDAVMVVQRALSLYGLSPDGVFTSEVEAAVRTFQADYGLKPVDGIVGKKTLAVMEDFGRKLAADKPGRKPAADKPVLDTGTSLFKSPAQESPQAPGGSPASGAPVEQAAADKKNRNQIIAGVLAFLAVLGIAVAVTD